MCSKLHKFSLTRYQTAQKQANSGGNVTKIDGIKEEMEEALLKVDQTRDALAADIYPRLAKESDYAKVCLFGQWFHQEINQSKTTECMNDFSSL